MPLAYHLGRAFCLCVQGVCVRVTVLRPERARRDGGFILACTHIAHLEPIGVMVTMPRAVRWLTRVEFYRHRLFAWVLRVTGMIPIDRFGYSLPALREAIRSVERGEVVGIFPEGGVARGADSVLRGGAIKQGAGVIARRTGAPIIPVVILGTDHLSRASAWLPLRRSRAYIAYGREVRPPAGVSNRAARAHVARDLTGAFQEAYRELIAHTGLSDAAVP